ncbi:MAG: hypothetical protein K2Z81_15730, partial [Cyanobacteria bacterium]|nr:hypothetical protein [Cyanobacteriota bacterium]
TEESQSVFGAIAESIVYQQLTGKAAATIHGRFKKIYNTDDCPLPEDVFNTPDTVLREAGLSRAKTAAIKDLAARARAGEIPTLEQAMLMTDEEIVRALSAVRGVGVWTAQMFLIFRLGRLDVMPSTDYGIRKGFALAIEGDPLKLPTPKRIESHAESNNWAPYRTVASWYLWRALEL